MIKHKIYALRISVVISWVEKTELRWEDKNVSLQVLFENKFEKHTKKKSSKGEEYVSDRDVLITSVFHLNIR